LTAKIISDVLGGVPLVSTMALGDRDGSPMPTMMMAEGLKHFVVADYDNLVMVTHVTPTATLSEQFLPRGANATSLNFSCARVIQPGTEWDRSEVPYDFLQPAELMHLVTDKLVDQVVEGLGVK